MKKCVSILVGVLAVIAAAAAVLVALDRFRKQTDEDPNDFEVPSRQDKARCSLWNP